MLKAKALMHVIAISILSLHRLIGLIMNCLVIAATAVEIAPFLEYYRNSKNLKTQS